MRISDWSSDVCSSDLHGRGFGIEKATRFRKRKAFLIPRFHRIRIGREPRLGMGDQLSSRNDLIHNLQLQGLSRLHRTATEQQVKRSLHACDTEKPLRSAGARRSEEHTSELQSLMRSQYAVLCLKKKQKDKVTK